MFYGQLLTPTATFQVKSEDVAAVSRSVLELINNNLIINQPVDKN